MISSTNPFPQQVEDSRSTLIKQDPILLESNSGLYKEDDNSVDNCQNNHKSTLFDDCDDSEDDSSHLSLTVMPLMTSKQTRRRSSTRRSSWEFNIEWDDGDIGSSFTSRGTEGQNSMYLLLKLDPHDDDSEGEGVNKLKPVPHSCPLGGESSFKREGDREGILIFDECLKNIESADIQVSGTSNDVKILHDNSDQDSSKTSREQNVLKVTHGELMKNKNDLQETPCRASLRKCSWKFNTDWDISSFTSIGTDGGNSLYLLLDLERDSSNKEGEKVDESNQVLLSSTHSGEPFKRGSVLSAVLSEDRGTPFGSSSNDLFDEFFLENFEPAAVEGLDNCILRGAESMQDKNDQGEDATETFQEHKQSKMKGDVEDESSRIVMEQKLHRASRRISWKFNTDWDGGTRSSFTSRGTDGESSIYWLLGLESGSEDEEDLGMDEFSQDRRSSSIGSESFKRGSIHSALLLEDTGMSFQPSSRALVGDISEECYLNNIEPADIQGSDNDRSNGSQADLPTQTISRQEIEIFDLKTSLGRLIHMETDLAHLLSTNSFEIKDIKLLQERVRNLKALDEELSIVADVKAKAA